APVRRRDRLGVVVDAPEVEVAAEAREVAGVGGGVGALALHERQAAHEGGGGESGGAGQGAGQDLLLPRRGAGLHPRRRVRSGRAPRRPARAAGWWRPRPRSRACRGSRGTAAPRGRRSPPRARPAGASSPCAWTSPRIDVRTSAGPAAADAPARRETAPAT